MPGLINYKVNASGSGAFWKNSEKRAAYTALWT